jgi:hypothetical protein
MPRELITKRKVLDQAEQCRTLAVGRSPIEGQDDCEEGRGRSRRSAYPLNAQRRPRDTPQSGDTGLGPTAA